MIHDPVLVNDWHAVAPVKHLEANNNILPARVLGEDIVIWRSNDKLMVWKDLCLHRGTRLSLGEIQEGDKLMCPYHGWTYNTDGQCVLMPAHPEQVPPAKARVTTYHVTIAYDFIWVCFDEPEHQSPPFPEWHDAAYRRVLCGPYTFNAAGPRMVENFLDVAHFPFVHENILGTRERPDIPDYQVVTDERGITAENILVFQPNPDGSNVPKWVNYTYKVFRPLQAYLSKASQEEGFAILLMVTPIEERKSLMWMWMVMNHSYDVPEQELREFQDGVAMQDLPIVESQRPELLPLDLQAELHLRSDRLAIAYRTWLGKLGLTFGVA
jgi:phenylpropionate dioxygenase-like ring-hydroxylating dioxygenase large terminal subunit